MKKLSICFGVLLSALLLTSCAKEQGCTDASASNYNPDAVENDNSCTYEGSLVFWYDSQTADDLYFDGSSSLKYYIDGALIGSSAADVYWQGAPSCGQSGSISVTKSLGTAKSKSVNYRVLDDFNDVIWEGVISIEAGACTKFRLIY